MSKFRKIKALLLIKTDFHTQNETYCQDSSYYYQEMKFSAHEVLEKLISMVVHTKYLTRRTEA